MARHPYRAAALLLSLILSNHAFAAAQSQPAPSSSDHSAVIRYHDFVVKKYPNAFYFDAQGKPIGKAAFLHAATAGRQAYKITIKVSSEAPSSARFELTDERTASR